MGLLRNLALINLTNPNALSQDIKDALQAKWEYDITHPKKKSGGLGGIVKGVTGLIGDVIHTTGKVVGNLGQSSINVVKETAKGNIGRAISNAANVATLGTGDFTGNNRGILNISSTKYLKALTGGGVGATASTSMLPDTTDTTTTKKKKGLLTQLRQPKGAIGGGSYTETVKNPLGGSAGKTGK